MKSTGWQNKTATRRRDERSWKQVTLVPPYCVSTDSDSLILEYGRDLINQTTSKPRLYERYGLSFANIMMQAWLSNVIHENKSQSESRLLGPDSTLIRQQSGVGGAK